jgi:hypothetical protein
MINNYDSVVLPPALVQSSSDFIICTPFPLQAFWPLQALAEVLQAPFPLQLFTP